ncbi:MAG TPA: type II toxin-antitoxin system prevent-host-death family antitoxin [Acetobacteraceae bacterium]|nr:type II toxin-antitoxin system prevent-host-death family antitoxin [Acetobacteraceae bacterium]
MSHISYTELRQNLAKVMDEVCDSGAPMVVTRQGRRSVVMISEAEFEAMQETLHLLRTPANARHVMESVAQADAGRLIEREIE